MLQARADWAEETAHMLKEERGFTSHPFSGSYAGEGYGVSPYPERTLQLDPEAYSENELALLITRFVVRNADLLRQPNHYVGGWRRRAHDMFLDVSIITASKREAKRICKNHEQEAFHAFA